MYTRKLNRVYKNKNFLVATCRNIADAAQLIYFLNGKEK